MDRRSVLPTHKFASKEDPGHRLAILQGRSGEFFHHVLAERQIAGQSPHKVNARPILHRVLDVMLGGLTVKHPIELAHDILENLLVRELRQVLRECPISVQAEHVSAFNPLVRQRIEEPPLRPVVVRQPKYRFPKANVVEHTALGVEPLVELYGDLETRLHLVFLQGVLLCLGKFGSERDVFLENGDRYGAYHLRRRVLRSVLEYDLGGVWQGVVDFRYDGIVNDVVLHARVEVLLEVLRPGLRLELVLRFEQPGLLQKGFLAQTPFALVIIVHA
mmetsp:Transcript_25027/g.59461  ORF Transcript_25027/g.59461 Transcript_25027/m.59461 type:complete len:275 (+) Transcript_25027:198-1022(+)